MLTFTRSAPAAAHVTFSAAPALSGIRSARSMPAAATGSVTSAYRPDPVGDQAAQTRVVGSAA